MSSPDYGSFFNAAAALFPIMLLTKTISFRNRRTVAESLPDYGKGRLLSVRDELKKGPWRSGWSRQFLSRCGHILHILAVVIGEVLAVYGVWRVTKGHNVAVAALVFLVMAAFPLVVELLVDTFRA